MPSECQVNDSCADGVCSSRFVGCSQDVNTGLLTQLLSTVDPRGLRFAGQIMLAGHSSLSALQSESSGQKSKYLRHASQSFMEWLVQERGGIRVGGKNYSLSMLLADDLGAASETASALAYSATRTDANFAVGGYGSSLNVHSAEESRNRGLLMLTAGASRSSIFEATGSSPASVFGFLPQGHSYDEALFQGIIDFASKMDGGQAMPRGAACRPEGCLTSLRVAYVQSTECGDYIPALAEQYFGQENLVMSETLPEEAGEQAYANAVEQFKALGATVVFFCSKAFEPLQHLLSAMESLDYTPYALLGKGQAVSDTYRSKVQLGWWQGSYVLDTNLWDSTANHVHGEFSGMTSAEFAERFRQRWGYQPSYLCAAQFAALSTLAGAIESADSLDANAVTEKMRMMNATEFYAKINFDAYGQIAFMPNVEQVPLPFHANDPRTLEFFNYATVWPRADRQVAFPMPVWAFRRCVAQQVDSDGRECYGHGLCSVEGVCECDNEWTGKSCEIRVAPDTALMIAITILVVVVLVMCLGIAWLRWQYLKRRRKKHEKACDAAMADLEAALWAQDQHQTTLAEDKLGSLGYSHDQISAEVSSRRKHQSEEAGVSAEYILSHEFTKLARARTGKEDPTFYDMKDAFFFGPDSIGRDAVCPRDNEKGCALVDILHAKHRQRCTHFLSWTWGYKLSMVQDALNVWISNDEHLDARDTFLFMCFFVNNQYRILVEGQQVSPKELQITFEKSLTRIGRVIALLDTWDNPRYLTRIWTIFEQLVAIKLEIPVTMVLPEAAGKGLVGKFEEGKEGILQVMEALTKVDSQSAEAHIPADAEAVKSLIQEQFSYIHVDRQIVHFMLRWMAGTFEAHMRSIMTPVTMQPEVLASPLLRSHSNLSYTVLNGTESLDLLFASAPGSPADGAAHILQKIKVAL
mmetsp:Transcript_87241/g.154546  ORF Transcript_87241/g.154546 Transcript_87241/m.154546 type:complete len:921 (-) Transcript_87241:127-2889(-)